MESPLIVREDSRVVKVVGYGGLTHTGTLEGGRRGAKIEARTRLGGRLTNHDCQYQGEAHQYHPDPKQGEGKVFALFFHGRTLANPGEINSGAGVNICEQQDPGQGARIISNKKAAEIYSPAG